MADAGESLVIRQVRYAIKKSAKLLGDNVFIGLASGRVQYCMSSVIIWLFFRHFNIDETSAPVKKSDS